MTSVWKFNNTDLTEATGKWRAWDISGANDNPPLRGSDIAIPFQHGATWTKKYYDEKIIVLAMWIKGTSLTDTQSNLDSVRRIFGIREQAILQRTMPDATVLQAMAEVSGQPTFVYHGPLLVTGTVDFRLSEPFMRSLSLDTEVVTIANSPYDLVNGGTAEEQRALITFTGPLDHPILTNTTNNVAVQYNDTLSSGAHSVVLDCGALTAILDGSTNVIGSIIHTGDPAFMTLDPLHNAMTLTDNTGTNVGTATIEFYPPYL